MSVSSTNSSDNDTSEQWPIRECRLYSEEYSDCRSVKAKFHQYFIYGEIQDCSQWKEDFHNCVKWMDGNDKEAYNNLVISEKQRFTDRMRAHYQNDVWQKRTEPPGDWNKPLPEWMTKMYENTYLDHRSRQLKEEAPSNEPERSMCVVS